MCKRLSKHVRDYLSYTTVVLWYEASPPGFGVRRRLVTIHDQLFDLRISHGNRLNVLILTMAVFIRVPSTPTWDSCCSFIRCIFHSGFLQRDCRGGSGRWETTSFTAGVCGLVLLAISNIRWKVGSSILSSLSMGVGRALERAGASAAFSRLCVGACI